MRVLVIGGNEMAGHVVAAYLAKRTPYELFYTSEEKRNRSHELHLIVKDCVMVEKLLEAIRPDVIINCTGIINDLARLHEVDAYRINGLLPHQLAGIADSMGSRLIQLSTDSVFSAERSSYEERHVPNGTSVYAKTKALGEVNKRPHLTIRTSLIGPEAEVREQGIGLLHWFLQQRNEIKGYVNVPWNGVTTLELAKFIHHAVEEGKGLNGIVHLTAPETISKYQLLELLRFVFDKDITIRADDAVVLDRILKSTRELGYTPPTYVEMLTELRDWMRYERYA